MKYAIKVPVDDGWLYVTETDTNGNLVAKTFDTREEAEAFEADAFNFNSLSQVVEYQEILVDTLTEEEIEELRTKKQAIKEELYDKVKMKMFKESSKLEGIDYDKISRVEVIDETGRGYIRYLKDDEHVRYAVQDDGRTLKIFITNGNDDLYET
jgi:hypothetical protein